MAILLRGMTKCGVCGEVIQGGDEAILFPYVISNENDPIWRLSDSSCHIACVGLSPELQKLVTITEEHYRRTGPGKRKCEVCGEEILDPDDCLMFGYLGDPATEALARFNFTHLHKSHAVDWKPAASFVAMAHAAIDEGRWGGPYLATLIRNIEPQLR